MIIRGVGSKTVGDNFAFLGISPACKADDERGYARISIDRTFAARKI
jgi:hypothetical protein